MPLVGRMSEKQRRQRRIDREWDAAAQNDYRDGWDANSAFSAFGDVSDMPLHETPDGFGTSWTRATTRGKQSRRLRWRDRHFSTRLLVTLALLSVVMGFCCTQSTLSLVDALAAGRDAQAQMTTIESMLKGGNYFDTDHLTELQTHLVTLDGDLSRLQHDVPWGVSHVPVGSSVAHLLNMASLLAQAGRYGVDAGLILLPHLKAIFSDIGSSSSATSSAATPTATATATSTAEPGSTNSSTAGVTVDEVTRAQQDIAAAGALVEQAIAERQQINDGLLSHVGLGKFVTLLAKLDTVTPKLPTYVGYARTVMNALPSLLGLSAPEHLLLFDMDSDELRPSGGFLGNYALLTIQNGHLVGGIHLKDVITLDCPNGVCPTNPIPATYAWMNIDPQHFGMRDSNLSPDFPTSAQLVMQQYQRESGQKVDGVIMITPEIIKDILQVTGAISVPGFSQSVNAKNLQDVIHYYHILSGNTGGTTSTGTTQRKVIDTLLGGALLLKFARLDATKQSTVMRQIVQGLSTKDVQVYMTDPQVQAALVGLNVASSVSMPAGSGVDGLMATDANVGATYYNSDIKETVADTITFDQNGDAIHDATISYQFQMIEHLYTPLLLHGNITWYDDVVRILTPTGAKFLDAGAEVVKCPTSCYPVDAPDQGHQVWAIRIQNLQRGQTVVLHFKWTSPKVLHTVNGVQEYHLQLYRQAGNHISYDITIKPPAKSQITQPLPAPFKTPAKTAPGTAAVFSIPTLTKDTLLTISFNGS